MTRRVFLHIGTPKSGTTYVQGRLAANRELLAEHGLTILKSPSGDHFRAAIDLIDKHWAGELEAARGSWDALVKSASGVKGDILISHEVLAAATPHQVARAFDSFPKDEIHIIVTARDLARQIPAEWQERIKHRGTASFAKFVKRVVEGNRYPATSWFWRVQHLPDLLSRWSVGLEPQRVHLVVVPAEHDDEDSLWTRFLSVVGLPHDLDYAPAPETNASLGVAEVRALRRVNNLLNKRKVSRPTYIKHVRNVVVKEVFAQRALRVASSQAPVAQVHPDLNDFLDEVYREWMDWVSGAQIDVVGHLDELRGKRTDPDLWVDPDTPDPNELFEATVTALAAVVGRLDEDSDDPDLLRRLRRRIG